MPDLQAFIQKLIQLSAVIDMLLTPMAPVGCHSAPERAKRSPICSSGSGRAATLVLPAFLEYIPCTLGAPWRISAGLTDKSFLLEPGWLLFGHRLEYPATAAGASSSAVAMSRL